MPPRRELTPQEALERYEGRREQSRLGMARLRAERRAVSQPEAVSQHVLANTNGLANTPLPETAPLLANQTPGGLTPPVLPARNNVPPLENDPPPPKGGAPQTALSAVPKPDKVAEVIDALRARGMRGTLTGHDRKTIKDIDHDPEEVAALYTAIFKREYGDAFMKKNLSVALCLEKWMPGWLSDQAGYRKPTSVLDGVLHQIATDPVEGPSTWH